MESTAYCEVILSKSGREIWFDLLLAYHGDDYVKDEATTAAMEIAKLRFDKKCSLTRDKFVSDDYKLCLFKMADNGTPFPEPLVKADFLSKVTHPGLRNWKLLMEENELITHNEMFTKFCKQMEKLGETTREDSGKPIQVNQQVKTEDSPPPTHAKLMDNEKKVVDEAIAKGDEVPDTLWKKIPWSLKRQLLNKPCAVREAQYGNTRNARNGNELPSQYSNRNLQVVQDNNGQQYNLVPVGENDDNRGQSTDGQQSNGVQLNYVGAVCGNSSSATPGTQMTQTNRQRAGTFLARVNNMTYNVSSKARAKMSIQSYQQEMEVEGSLFVDGGTNASAMGKQFHIFKNDKPDM